MLAHIVEYQIQMLLLNVGTKVVENGFVIIAVMVVLLHTSFFISSNRNIMKSLLIQKDSLEMLLYNALFAGIQISLYLDSFELMRETIKVFYLYVEFHVLVKKNVMIFNGTLKAGNL